MTPKKLLLIGIALVVLVNGSIFGTLLVAGVIGGGDSATDAETVEPESEKEPLPAPEPFKSKANYIRSIGEAMTICEQRLHESVKVPKSSSINTVESRYEPSQEVYKIFLVYETISRMSEPAKSFNVICEVSAERKTIDLWKPMAN